MTERVETVVIGAGVVGLAIARALAQAGREVIILEAADAIGTGTSARNSEVIHAGIYYPPGSLKARFCVAGRKALYAYCAQHGVPHRRCGKLIVATTDAERESFAAIAARAQANGVDDLKVLSRAEAVAMEPALTCTGALHSPSTGIIDSHALMLALLGDGEEAGAMLALNAPVTGAKVLDDGIELTVGGADPMTLLAAQMVNSAGHGAIPLALLTEGLPHASVPPAWRAKGSYFRLQGRAPFTRLIYPAPVDGGLGVHLTLDIGGQARFGPDVEWRQDEDYAVDPRRGDSFYAAVRRYWPALPDGALQPDYAGIRPKVTGPGEPAGDFILSTPADHGVAGLVCLYGIESPGLTSCLAIADVVAAAL